MIVNKGLKWQFVSYIIRILDERSTKEVLGRYLRECKGVKGRHQILVDELKKNHEDMYLYESYANKDEWKRVWKICIQLCWDDDINDDDIYIYRLNKNLSKMCQNFFAQSNLEKFRTKDQIHINWSIHCLNPADRQRKRFLSQKAYHYAIFPGAIRC